MCQIQKVIIFFQEELNKIIVNYFKYKTIIKKKIKYGGRLYRGYTRVFLNYQTEKLLIYSQPTTIKKTLTKFWILIIFFSI